ncbi:uncharacterized protein LOC123560773 [Mercenaria mercenaria]|uniref:uncharacterized protein LOC123560773 n=1 Tax=Mercenaria mercenaria TaxID=6596 RepID=UPI00234E9D82|nr:uncharacterized protein LOC123560773 [Mercenaria mercenaria]
MEKNHVKVATYGWNVSTVPTTASTCTTPNCPSCPPGYQIYYEHTYQCQYRCLCEISRTPSTTSKPSMSKMLLLSILHNIQNNADALEQMARGLSDEADLAQDAAALSHK